MNAQPFVSGMTATPEDVRDFKYEDVFGAPPPAPLEDFLVSTPIIKDQGRTDLCTAYMATEGASAQDEMVFEPAYTFAQTKKILGSIEGYGANPRVACQAVQKFGALPYRMTRQHIDEITEYDRDYLANWENWSAEDVRNADEFRKESFFDVVMSGGDVFDSMVSALYANRAQKRLIMTGCKWRGSWNLTEGGIVPDEYSTEGIGHAFVFIGQKIIDAIQYLVCQNSFGTDYGDDGLFYFPRSVINREFVRSPRTIYGGMYMFNDMPKAEAKWRMQNNLPVGRHFYVDILLAVRRFFVG